MKRKIALLVRRIKDTQDEEINCSECLDQVSKYVDLELTTRQAAEQMPLVKQHLEQCGVCWDEYQVLRQLAQQEASGSLPTNDELIERLKRQSK